jgi:hypothetical protein
MAGKTLSPRVMAIAADLLKVAAEQISVTQLTGDASTRVYYRAAGADSSAIISIYEQPFDSEESASARLDRLASSNPSARLTFASDPCAQIETTDLFLKADLPVPPIIAVSGADSAVFIEDVGDIKLQDWLAGRSEREIEEAYFQAIELIVRIQEATPRAAGSICSRLAFDEAKLRWELGFFFAHYFNRYLKVKLDPSTSNAVEEDFKALCSELASRRRALTHRDYHARNLMVWDGRIFMIDYQDARMGPESYDLASLLYDPYTNLSTDAVDSLTEKFIESKSRSGLPLSDIDGFREELKLMTVQRMLKAIGTYSYQAAVKENRVYVRYIAPALDRATEAMKSLGRFPRTRGLLEATRQ